jgi:hypothetical protein
MSNTSIVIRQENVSTVYEGERRAALVVDNFQFDVEFGKSSADEVGVEHVVMMNFPGAIPGTESLAEIFRYNVEQLYNAKDACVYTVALREENENLEDRLTIYQITKVLVAVVVGVETVFLYTKRWTL